MLYKITDYRFKKWISNFQMRAWFVNPLLFRVNVWLAILGWLGFGFACFYCTGLISNSGLLGNSLGEVFLFFGTILFCLNLLLGIVLLWKAVRYHCASLPFLILMFLGPLSLFVGGFYGFWKKKNKKTEKQYGFNANQPSQDNVASQDQSGNSPKKSRQSISKGFLTRSYNWQKYDRILIHPVDAWISIFGALLLPNIVYIVLAALGITNQPTLVRNCMAIDLKCNERYNEARQQQDENKVIAGNVQIALLVVGILVALWMIFRYKKAIFQDGISVFFFFNSFQLLILLLPFSLINDAFPRSSDQATDNNNLFNVNAWGFFSQSLLQMIYVSFFFWKSPLLKTQLRETFNKKNLGKTVTLIFSFLALAYAANYLLSIIDNGFFSAKDSLSPGDTSDNQETLNGLYKKPITIVLLFFSTVMIAPVCEEMAMRNGLSRLSINPVAGFFASWIFFAAMHVNSNGDWEQILSYLGLSLGASLAYLATKSVYPGIAIHSAWNLVAFIQGVTTYG